MTDPDQLEHIGKKIGSNVFDKVKDFFGKPGTRAAIAGGIRGYADWIDPTEAERKADEEVRIKAIREGTARDDGPGMLETIEAIPGAKEAGGAILQYFLGGEPEPEPEPEACTCGQVPHAETCPEHVPGEIKVVVQEDEDGKAPSG